MTSADFGAEEGEISEAIPLPRFAQETLVDPVERTRFSRSNDYEHSHDVPTHRRSRSPRGFKRTLDDRDRRDERVRPSSRFSGREKENRGYGGGYHDRQHASRQPYQGSYRDLDRPVSRDSNYGQSDTWHDERRNRNYNREPYHDDHSNKRHRNRSRSPRYRDDRGRRDRDRHSKVSSEDYMAAQNGQGRYQPAPKFVAQTSKSGRNGPVEQGLDNLAISQASANPPAQDADPEPDFDWDPAQERNKEAEMEAEIERRRRAREAALKRALQASDRPSSTPESTQVNTPAPAKAEADTPCSGDNMSPILSPPVFGPTDEDGLADTDGDMAAAGDGPLAADYDPTADMREDERRDEMRHGHVGLHGTARQTSRVEEPAPNNIEDEDGINLFGEEEIDEAKLERFRVTTMRMQQAAKTSNGPANGVGGGNIDTANAEGYYKIRPGDMLTPHYRIMSSLGSGMFSCVARAEDQRTKRVVAIKIMRNNDALRRGGLTEINILKKLNDADPEDKKHIIRFQTSFDYRGHLCMVFESLDLNLREVVKKYGKDSGINLRAVQKYALQIFVALAHMRKHGIIHADLKPDNILVDDTRTMLKICDLGTAIDREDAATVANEVTPYLVSRFYRPPEVILGIPYDCAADVWSIGCTLYELFTGKILFTGRTNNQMLRVMQELRGKINPKLQRRGRRAHLFFDEHGNFISRETDKDANVISQKVIPAFPQSTRLKQLVYAGSKDLSEDQLADLPNFLDLVERCLHLNPEKRLTPQEALQHPFLAKPANKPARHQTNHHAKDSN